MAQTIQYNGKNYNFPDDATDEEISLAMKSLATTQQKPTEAPEPAKATQPQPEQKQAPSVGTKAPVAPPAPSTSNVFPQSMGEALAMRPDAPQKAKPVEASTVAERAKGLYQGADYQLSRQLLTGSDYLANLYESTKNDLTGSAYKQNLVSQRMQSKLRDLERYREEKEAISPTRKESFSKGREVGEFGETFIPVVGEGLRLAGAAGESYESNLNKAIKENPTASDNEINNKALGQATKDMAITAGTDALAMLVGGKTAKYASKPVSKAVGNKLAGRVITGGVSGALSAETAGTVAAGVNTVANGGSLDDAGKAMYDTATDWKTAGVGAVMGAKSGAKAKSVEGGKFTKEQQQNRAIQEQEYSKADNSVQRAKVLENSPEKRASDAADVMREFDIPIHDAAHRDNAVAQAMFNTKGNSKIKDSELSRSITNANGEKTTLGEQISNGFDSYHKNTVSKIDQIHDAVSSMVKKTESLYKEEATQNNSATSKVKQESFSALKDYQDALKQHSKTMKSKEATDAAKIESAKVLDEAYSKLGDTEKSHINQLNKDAGGKGTPDHLLETQNYIDVSKNVENMLPGKKYEKPKTSAIGEIANTLTHGLAGKVISGTKKTLTMAQAYGTRQRLKANSETSAMNTVAKPERETVPELAPQEPGQEKTTVSRYAAEKYNQTRNQEVETLRNQIVSPELKQQITRKDLQNPEQLKAKMADLKKQDASMNVERIKQANETKNTLMQTRANVQHEANVKELARWQKEEGNMIPQKYIDKAIAERSRTTPEGKRITNVNAVKSHAERLFMKEGGNTSAAFRGRKQDVYAAIQRDLPPEVHQSAKAVADRAYGNNNRLTGDALKQVWKDVYQVGADHLTSNGRGQEAKSLMGEGHKKANIISNRQMSSQHDLLADAMRKKFESTHEEILAGDKDRQTMSKQEQEQFIDEHINNSLSGRKEPMSKTELNDAISKATDAVTSHANEWHNKDIAERAKSLGVSEQDAKAISDLQPKEKLSKEASDHLQNDMTTELFNALDSGDHTKIGTLKENHDALIKLMDGQTSGSFQRFSKVVESANARLEGLDKVDGYKKALFSFEDYTSLAKHMAEGNKGRILKLAGVKDPKELLTEKDRAQLESDIRSGRVQEQQKAEALKAKQEKNRKDREAKRSRINGALTQNNSRVFKPKA